jgi:hypothetical protein
MRCSIVILFTCVLVLSRPVGKGGGTCETLIVGTNSQILGGPRQTRRYMWKRAGKISSLAWERGHDGGLNAHSRRLETHVELLRLVLELRRAVLEP